MPFTCGRILAVTFSLAILLVICIISFEIDFSSWGINTRSTLTKGFADAAPLQAKDHNELADLMTDADLHEDGKEQHEKELFKQQNANSQHRTATEPDVSTEVRDETIPAPSSSQKDNNLETSPNLDHVNNSASEDQETRNDTSSPENDTESEPVKTADHSTLGSEGKNVHNSEKEDVSLSSSQIPPSPSLEQGSSSKRRTRAKTFLVVFMGHSGSTAFTTELRTHTDFIVEFLEPLEHGELQFDTDKAIHRARKLMDRGIAQGKIPGFKIRPFHVLNKPELWQGFVQRYDTRIIWQYRENVIKQAVGEYRHKFLNDSSVVEGLSTDVEPCQKGSGQICRFKIDNFRGLHGLMNEFSTSDELLTKAVRLFRREKEMHVVRYEDYLYNRERTMRDVFEFLGVDYQDTESQRRKASPDNLCEMVSNFQELCDRFMQCQLWRPFLTDDRNDCRCKPGQWQPFDPSFCKRVAWYQNVKK